jgi:DNA-binding transcriptional ArsR family regulator
VGSACNGWYHRAMTMPSTSHDADCAFDLSPAVALFRSLGDPTRLAIVHEIAGGERRIVDLTARLGLAQSTVSAHMACLRDSGLVESRPVGRQSLYRLTRPELLTVLTAAEQLLEATGNPVHLCPLDETGALGAETA